QKTAYEIETWLEFRRVLFRSTVMGGMHAWVLHGFESAADPVLDANAYIRAAYVSGPLWPRAAQTGGFDPAPDTRLSPASVYHFRSEERRVGKEGRSQTALERQ